LTSRETSTDPAQTQRLLILMRHAKSDWDDSALADRDRPLNERGRRDAPRMARWLADIGLVPDRVLSSPSRRTRETAELMLAQWDSQPLLCFSEPLYLSSPETILDSVRSDGGDARRLLVLAHNPGMTHLVSGLAHRAVDMPTAAIAVFQLALSDWGELRPSLPHRMIHYMRPKLL
jgi:phosphohistidine phosphatase